MKTPTTTRHRDLGLEAEMKHTFDRLLLVFGAIALPLAVVISFILGEPNPVIGIVLALALSHAVLRAVSRFG